MNRLSPKATTALISAPSSSSPSPSPSHPSSRTSSHASISSTHSISSQLTNFTHFTANIINDVSHQVNQLSSLVKKNWTCYFRNKSNILSEAGLTLLYFSLLLLLSFTVTTELVASHPVNPIQSLYSSISGPTIYNNYFTSKCRSKPLGQCRIGFTTTASGCTTELAEFMRSMAICSSSSIYLPTCSCIDASILSNYTQIDDHNMVAAYEFHSSHFSDFTLHVEDIGYSTMKAIISPGYGPNEAGQLSAWKEVSSLLVALYSHLASTSSTVNPYISESTMLEIFAEEIGQIEYETTENLGLMNFPLYMTVIFIISMQTVVTEISKEREKKLDQGLFMSGCSPYIYWYSWATISFVRLMVSFVLGITISWLFLVPSTNIIIVAATMFTFSVFSIFYGLSLSMMIKKTKLLASALVWTSIVFSIPTFLNTKVMLDSR